MFTIFRRLVSRRFLLTAAGVFSVGYALTILVLIPFVPTLGLRTLVDCSLRQVDEGFIAPGEPLPKEGDTVIGVGNQLIRVWPDLIKAPETLHRQQAAIEHGIDAG